DLRSLLDLRQRRVRHGADIDRAADSGFGALGATHLLDAPGKIQDGLVEVENPGDPDRFPGGVSLDVQRLARAAEVAVLIQARAADGRFDVVVPVRSVEGPADG